MKTIKIPEGHQVVMPYLMLQGASKFRDFVKKVFDAEETFTRMRDDDSIMHAETKIGDSTIMYTESTDEWKPQPANLFVYVPNADEVFKKAIAEGAKVIMELDNKDYGRSGGIQDPYGNTWWITSVN